MINRKNRLQAFINYIEGELFDYREPIKDIRIKPFPYLLKETIEIDEEGWETFCYRDRWGVSDTHFLFDTSIEGIEGKNTGIFLSTGETDLWNTDNPQILLYVDGVLHSTFDMNHQYALITKGESEKHRLTFYAYSNNSDKSCTFNLDKVVVDEAVKALYFDFKNVFEAAILLPEDDKERIKAFKVLENAIAVLDTRSHERLHDSAEKGSAVIWEYLDGRKKSDVTVYAVGSTHIDVAWKWPVRQTREKAVRSVLTAINLMDKYPDFRFLLSQPQLYQFIKEQTPSLFERIKERIKEGRWEAEGAMWLEPDCNMTSGESLVRQIVYGQKFFQNELGAGKSRILWLPDAFGFPPALPTIMKEAGIDYFVTTKINWSDTDKFPYDTFIWRGLDGSEVLTHFVSTQNYGASSYNTTYNGLQNASQIAGTWKRFQDKDISNDVLTCYGFGDGGGGPTAAMLENTKRLEKCPCDIPSIKHSTVREYFDALSASLDRSRTPVWRGELYLEYHRGVFTSISDEKKWNSVVERAVRDAEIVSIISSIPYPEDTFERIWKTLLLNQFHDILPGSAIDEVYEIAFKEYEEAKALCTTIIENGFASLSDGSEKTSIFSSASHEIDAVLVSDNVYEDLPLVQKTYDGRYAYFLPSLNPMGFTSYSSALDSSDNLIKGTINAFDTPFYKVEIKDGFISSLYDKSEEREIVEEGKALNTLIAYEDRPLEFDNWNLEEYYAEKGYTWALKRIELVENGPVRGVIEAEWTYSESTIVEEIIFYAHTKRIDFNATIDWHDDHALVKAVFPTTIFAPEAWCGTQFGVQSRSNHRNTSWDQARFEVQAQRFVDLSEAGYGTALLSAEKYGYSVLDGEITLSLLKSGTYPALSGDKGVHKFTYSFFPHQGDWREGNVEGECEAVNTTLYAEKGMKSSSFVSVPDNLFISALKRSEDGKSIILRLYEGYGKRSKEKISFSEKFRISRTDLLEEKREELGVSDSVEILFTPYSLCTLSLERV